MIDFFAIPDAVEASHLAGLLASPSQGPPGTAFEPGSPDGTPFAAVLDKVRKGQLEVADLALIAQQLALPVQAFLSGQFASPAERMDAQLPDDVTRVLAATGTPLSVGAQAVWQAQVAEVAEEAGTPAPDTDSQAANGDQDPDVESEPTASGSNPPATVAAQAQPADSGLELDARLFAGPGPEKEDGPAPASGLKQDAQPATRPSMEQQDQQVAAQNESPPPAGQAYSVNIRAQASDPPKGLPATDTGLEQEARPPTVQGEDPSQAGQAHPGKDRATAGRVRESLPVETQTAASGSLSAPGRASLDVPADSAQASQPVDGQAGDQVERMPGRAEVAEKKPQEASLTGLEGARPANPTEIEPARSTEARSPQIVSQVSQAIEGLEKSGKSSLRLQLYPEDLGRIDLRLTSGPDGLHVALTADSPAAHALLERHLPELRQALSEAGVNLAGLSVGYGAAQEQGSQHPSRWMPEGEAPPYSHGLEPEGEPTPARAGQKSLSGSSVDYRI